MADLVNCLCIVLLLVVSVCCLDKPGPSFIQSLSPDKDNVDVEAEKHPGSADFSRHTVVKPRIYHGREKRQISTTKEKGNEHVSHLTITFDIDGENYILDLTLNKQLISKDFFHRYQENGTDRVHKPTAEEVELCHYNGKVRDKPNSWVALSTCDGLSGVFYDGKDMHYIEKDTKVVDSTIEIPHYVYKHSDISSHNKTCGYGYDATSHQHLLHKDNRMLRYKRALEDPNVIKGPYNSNKDSKYVELVLVIDNREYKELGENRRRVENHCKTIANIINGLYAPLNIFIALVGVVVWTEHDEISFSDNGDTTLTNFLHYRSEKLIKEHPNDNAQLLTKFNFNNGVVGKALKGPICTYKFSGGVSTDHSPVVGLVATTVAHEMGHNFGMEHDTTDCKCPENKCIMAASSSAVAPVHWSSCSLNYLLLAFTHGMDYCLKNKPQSLFDGPVCGNGFVEPGEQCDCGLPEHCDNKCCNPHTCMLHSNVTCGTGACCDLETCSLKTAGTECRSADYECDLPEYCTGKSEYCPANVFKMDTEPCNGGKAYCYQGFCRTRTDQCKLLWGETGRSSDEQCYKLNIKGNKYGNCGYNKLDESFARCENDDVLCGMLHCKHLNERLEFGMESVALIAHTFINSKGAIIPCRTAIVDLGINQVDPGLSPDGAKCGVDKMCVNQKCMSVESLRKTGNTCPNDCNGNGVCNSLGHCHCEVGFAPPFCESAGPGGSEHSGPASDPDAHKVFMNVLFIIFLGIIPLCAIIVFLWHYTRRNFDWMKTPPPTSKSPSKSRGSMFPPEPTKQNEDNHSLLQKDHAENLHTEFFGHFRGFSLTPMKQKHDPEPVRAAPPPPITSSPPNAPPTAANTKISSINRPNSPVKAATVTPTKNATATPVKSPVVSHSSTFSAAKSNFLSKPLVAKIQSFKEQSSTTLTESSAAPALPPPNPGSNSRPIISSPVLENSTCTAKELISPLRNAPKVPFRSAPVAPPNKDVDNDNKRPLSTPEVIVVSSSGITGDDVKKTVNSTLNRIASFLKPADKKPGVAQANTNSLSKSQMKANKIHDKNSLKNLEISNPILQTKIDGAKTAPTVDSDQNKVSVTRAQSMRGTQVTKRPPITTFGSMRQPGKRPVSIPSGVRPKSPPPPRPQSPDVSKDSKTIGDKIKIPNLPGYQKPQNNKPVATNQYDDCLNKSAPLASLNEEKSPSQDNIYAVIEESPVKSPIEQIKRNSGSSESVGLLGEIVSEIQNRNFDSIYSTSTLARKKKEDEEKARRENMKTASSDASELYENTSPYRSPDSNESVYSNMNNIKSSASSTSSGYIHPSAINVPIKPQIKTENSGDTKNNPKTNLSTFKSDKPITPFTKPEGPVISTVRSPSPASTNKNSNECDNKLGSTKIKTPPSPTNKTQKMIGRQTTPPNLRTRKASPTRPAPTAAPKANRSVTNSPDLVTSCNAKPTNKPPDVLVSGPAFKKPAVAANKPAINGLPKGPLKAGTGKAVSFKSPQDKKNPETKTPPNKIVKANSDMAAVKNVSSGVKVASRQNSTVASLQQKFENKTNLSTKPSVKSKA